MISFFIVFWRAGVRRSRAATYDGPGDVEVLGEHGGVEAVEEGLVDEVPGRLVVHALVLQVVGESGTLHEAVVGLVLVQVLQRLQILLGLLEGQGRLSLQGVVGHSSSDHVAVVPPGVGELRVEGYS